MQAAQVGDRATVDFEGKIDGEPFAGGKAQDFQFILGDGQMLKEFEEATIGMKLGESKTFQFAFPADYHGKDVAGKTADFMVTVKKIESAHLPEVDERTGQVAGHCLMRPVSKVCVPISQKNLAARGQVPPDGAQQAGRDGRTGLEGATRPAECKRAIRTGATDRRMPAPT
jgi:hypothetical protein